MEHEKPWLYMSLIKDQQARHLLLIFHNGSADTELVLMKDGVASSLAHGTEYETKEQAEAIAQIWIEDERFARVARDKFVWEPLAQTIALARKLGFTGVYDRRSIKTTWPNPNFTGEVPLSSWLGMTPKNGGRYLYALDQMRLHCRPALPAGLGPLVAPTAGQEFAAFMLKYKEKLDTVGTSQVFVLNDPF
jgi:hypothetical protein